MIGTAHLLAALAYQNGGEVRIDDRTLANLGPNTAIQSHHDPRLMQTVITVTPAPPPRKPYVAPADFTEVGDQGALPKPLARLSPP